MIAVGQIFLVVANKLLIASTISTASMRRVGLVLVGLIALVALTQYTEAAIDCQALVQEYYEFNRQQLAGQDGADRLFVLKTPSTYSQDLDTCLIRFGVPGTQRCPSFPEQIESNVFNKIQGCNVLSSSDDLSVLQSLTGGTAVAAELRDPVERLVAAYELAVEVAMQKLDADKSKNPFEAMQKKHPSDVWPWSQFSTFLGKDLQKRVRRQQLSSSYCLCQHAAKQSRVHQQQQRIYHYIALRLLWAV